MYKDKIYLKPLILFMCNVFTSEIIHSSGIPPIYPTFKETISIRIDRITCQNSIRYFNYTAVLLNICLYGKALINEITTTTKQYMRYSIMR